MTSVPTPRTRSAGLVAAGLLALVALAACGPNVSVSGAGGGSSSSANGTSSGGPTSTSSATSTSTGGTGKNSGDCDTDSDCPGSKCVELVPGGFRVCLDPQPEATKCSGSMLDQCCSSS